MKKLLLAVMALPMLIGMMISCTGAKADVKELDGKWNIVEVNGTKVQKEKMPFMEFNMTDNKLHGNAGCNMFNTVVRPDSKDKSSFTLAPAVSTMMACADMDMEGKVMKALENVHGVKKGSSANQMVLVDSAGKDLIVLSK